MDDNPIFTFRGTFPCTVDQKRRLTVPSRFAKALTPRASRTFVAVHGLERCLSLYPLDFWQVFEENLMEAQFSNEEARRGVRHLLASTVDLEMDNQNRVTLTPELLERARIKNGAVLNGVVTHLELWSPEIWDDYVNAQGAPTLEQAFKSLDAEYLKTTRQVRENRAGSNGAGPAGPAGGRSGSGE